MADATRKALAAAAVELLQPMMRLEVVVEGGDVGPVTTDITWVLGRGEVGTSYQF